MKQPRKNNQATSLDYFIRNEVPHFNILTATERKQKAVWVPKNQCNMPNLTRNQEKLQGVLNTALHLRHICNKDAHAEAASGLQPWNNINLKPALVHTRGFLPCEVTTDRQNLSESQV